MDRGGRLLVVTHSASASVLTPVSNNSDWHSANDIGMRYAAAENWHAAHTAFLTAIASAPAYRDAPATHAVLLGNLAQSRFHCGDTAGAVETARGALVARLISCDDGADAPMSRSRADLAVYLAAGGQHAEARRTLAQAREGLEAQFGTHDSRLISILENEARLAIAAGDSDAAEAPLSRLQTILAASGDDASRLAPLLARINDATAEFMRARAVADERTDDEDFDLVDIETHAPFKTPSAERIREAGLIEPGTHRTPVDLRLTNPLGFEVQYGIPQEILLSGNYPRNTEDEERENSPPAPETNDEAAARPSW